jgi:hypothetical protein
MAEVQIHFTLLCDLYSLCFDEVFGNGGREGWEIARCDIGYAGREYGLFFKFNNALDV